MSTFDFATRDAHPMYSRTGLVEAFDGTPVSYRVVGNGPTLVFCNGLGLESSLWRAIIHYLLPEYRVLTWDYPGHGQSGQPRESSVLSVESLADLLAAICEDAGVEQALFVGHSLGVQVLHDFCFRFEKRVSGLALVAGAPSRPLRSLGLPLLPQVMLEQLLATLERYETPAHLAWRVVQQLPGMGTALRYLVANPVLTDEQHFASYRQSLMHLDLANGLRALQEAERYPDHFPLAEVRVPTLIVAGELDWVTPHRVARAMAREIPDAELFTVRRGSHLCILDAPETIALRLRKFHRERILGISPAAGTEQPSSPIETPQEFLT